MSYDFGVFLILLSIATMTFTYDVMMSDMGTCLDRQCDLNKKIKILFVALFHHLFSIFCFFGWLFNNSFILTFYISCLVGMVVHWKLNKGKCIITQTISRLSEDESYKKFNDIYKIIGIKKYFKTRTLYYFSVIISITIAVCKLMLNDD